MGARPFRARHDTHRDRRVLRGSATLLRKVTGKTILGTFQVWHFHITFISARVSKSSR